MSRAADVDAVLAAWRRAGRMVGLRAMAEVAVDALPGARERFDPRRPAADCPSGCVDGWHEGELGGWDACPDAFHRMGPHPELGDGWRARPLYELEARRREPSA